MSGLFNYLPEIQGEEMLFIKKLTEAYTDEKLRDFATVYRVRRRDPQVILLTTLLGFVVVAVVQRFLVGQIGMGILYLLTAGLCFVGTIIDLVNYQKLALDYNQKIAQETASLIG